MLLRVCCLAPVTAPEQWLEVPRPMGIGASSDRASGELVFSVKALAVASVPREMTEHPPARGRTFELAGLPRWRSRRINCSLPASLTRVLGSVDRRDKIIVIDVGVFSEMLLQNHPHPVNSAKIPQKYVTTQLPTKAADQGRVS